jgi:hypothetical protein
VTSIHWRKGDPLTFQRLALQVSLTKGENCNALTSIRSATELSDSSHHSFSHQYQKRVRPSKEWSIQHFAEPPYCNNRSQLDFHSRVFFCYNKKAGIPLGSGSNSSRSTAGSKFLAGVGRFWPRALIEDDKSLDVLLQCTHCSRNISMC